MKTFVLIVCLLMLLRNALALRAGFAAKRLCLLLFWVTLGLAAVVPSPPLRLLAFLFLVLGLLLPQPRPPVSGDDDITSRGGGRRDREVKNITPRSESEPAEPAKPAEPAGPAKPAGPAEP